MNMQEHMYDIYNWQKTNNMKFNIAKFKWLQFGVRSKIEVDYSYFEPDQDRCKIERENVKNWINLVSLFI